LTRSESAAVTRSTTADDVMRSELFRGVTADERLATRADAWHLALIDKGFTAAALLEST
jgi:hypothetical protein